MSDIPAASASSQPPALIEAPLPEGILTAEQRARQTKIAVHIWCTVIFVGCAAMLGMGLYLTPSPNGLGTHQELNLPPCGWLTTLGFPCPTCGCTTAVSNFSHGHLIRSFLTQPFGFAVGLLGAVLLPLTLVGAVTGKWIGPSMFWLGWYWRRWVFGTVGILVGGWVYKIIIYHYQVMF